MDCKRKGVSSRLFQKTAELDGASDCMAYAIMAHIEVLVGVSPVRGQSTLHVCVTEPFRRPQDGYVLTRTKAEATTQPKRSYTNAAMTIRREKITRGTSLLCQMIYGEECILRAPARRILSVSSINS